MPEEKDDDEIKLPRWYLMLEKAAGKLSVGCISAELLIFFVVKHVFSPQTIEIIQALLIPFGLICVVISGYKSIDTINTIMEVLKKVKSNDK